MTTPFDKTKYKDEAQTRALAIFSSGAPENREKIFDTEYYVEGIAARYEPYILYYEIDLQTGERLPVYERFERGCFDNTDMSDIIYQLDHAGRVFARTGNNTLHVEPTDEGLFVAADLSKTEAARDHHGDIAAEMITKMSWRFRTGDCYYDAPNRTIVHRTVEKIYDVSAVSLPANDNTEINARAWVDGEIAQAARREAELDERRRKLQAKINISLGGIN